MVKARRTPKRSHRSPAKASRPAARRAPVRGRKSSTIHKTKAKTKKRKPKMATDKERADNPSQDPNHPMNKTVARDPKAPRADTIDGPVYSSENLMTEQEKDTSSDVPGVGPALPPEVEPEVIETIQEQGIGPRTPYPTGNPPPVHEEVTRSQGINKGRDDRAVPKPDKPAAKEHK